MIFGRTFSHITGLSVHWNLPYSVVRCSAMTDQWLVSINYSHFSSMKLCKMDTHQSFPPSCLYFFAWVHVFACSLFEAWCLWPSQAWLWHIEASLSAHLSEGVALSSEMPEMSTLPFLMLIPGEWSWPIFWRQASYSIPSACDFSSLNSWKKY